MWDFSKKRGIIKYILEVNADKKILSIRITLIMS